jgi:hypothetical protein
MSWLKKVTVVEASNHVGLRVGDIDVCEEGQRKLREDHVAELMRNFNERDLGTPEVSYRDGRYYVVDGQHRVTAARRKRGDGFVIVCKVHYGLTAEEEAEMFMAINEDRLRMDNATRIEQAIRAQDEDFNRLRRLVSLGGFDFVQRGQKKQWNQFSNHTVLFRILKAVGEEAFIQGLQLIADTWRGDSSASHTEMVWGAAEFMRQYGNQIDYARAIKQLKCIRCADVRSAAKASTSVQGRVPSKEIALVLVRVHNFNIKKGRIGGK